VGYKPAGEPPVDAFVARYARGRDYHKLLKRLAHELCDRIREVHPGLRARTLVDTAPLSERSLAARSGLGWIGRNGSLIVPGWGSYVVLTEILCDLDLPPDPPHPGGCGDCRACLAACPTGAFKAEKLLDARRCLSYHSIENRGEVPADIRLAWGNRVFGCDSCQEVCPQNRLARTGHPDLTASAEQGRSLAEILRWSREDWSAATEGSTRRRATWAMWLRNAVLAAAATGGEELIEPLRILRNRIAEEPELQECDFDLGALIDEAIAKRGGEI
jgi:epoxyqueuosine reductase